MSSTVAVLGFAVIALVYGAMGAIRALSLLGESRALSGGLDAAGTVDAALGHRLGHGAALGVVGLGGAVGTLLTTGVL